MTTKSDFAQKLLTDLRQRKERMAAAQNSSQHSSQASRVTRGNSGQASRGARQINVVESSGSLTGRTSRRSNGGSRSVNTKESSSQIVLYEGGQSSRQVGDLQMAIAFAFENSGNFSSFGGSSSNPLVNFFNRFGRKSPNSRKMETSTFYNQRGGGQFPTVSNIHINELSKGVHKLNQILSACSNGLNLDRNSIEIGRELLKGAMNLEESLRMLVSLNDAAEYANSSQKKSRIKLLDEDEEEEDDNEKRVEQWKLDRPRFSFDKTSRGKPLALPYAHETYEQPMGNLKLVPHKRSNSYVQDLSKSTYSNSSSSKSTQEKGRISNVVAKLMGLEELPLKEDLIGRKNDSKGKEWKQEKVSRESSKQNEYLIRESRNAPDLSNNRKLNSTSTTLLKKDSKVQIKPEKSSIMVNSERNQLRKDLKMQTAPDSKQATIPMKKQQNHANNVNGVKSFEVSEREQTHGEDKQNQSVDREGKMLVLNAELQKRTQKSTMLKAEDKTYNKNEQEASANLVEKKNAKSHPAINQQKVQDKHALLQEQVSNRADHSEDKSFTDEVPLQFQKQNLMAKNHEGRKVEHINASKSKRSGAMNFQKKLPHGKSIPGDGRFIKQNDKVPVKDPPSRRRQDAAPIIDSSQKTAANQDSPKIERKIHNSPKSENESQIDIEKGSTKTPLTEQKPIETSVTQKRTFTRKVQRREIPEKIEVLVTRRNATGNRLTRSIKGPANMLKDLKQQMQNKNHGSKRLEEQSDSKVKEGKEVINAYNASEMNTEPVKPEEKLETKDDQLIISDSGVADEFPNQNKLNHSNNSDSIVSNSGDVLNDLQTEETPSLLKDDEEIKKCDKNIESHEERTELDLPLHGYMQFPALDRQEQLTEPEKTLKETVIKNQLFLSTAEALFKLNIPVSFLHFGDHENEVGEKKLELDSAFEVMKRKARRYEFVYHPHLKTTISTLKLRSLDDLVRQLCKDLEVLKSYGMNGSDECDVAAGLHKMLKKDIYSEHPDVNCMWDYEWSRMMSIFNEMEDVVKDVERHMLNGMLDEITNDFFVTSVSV